MAELLTQRETDPLALLGTALSDPCRRRVLLQLADGPAYAGDLASCCETSKSNMSNHLKCLRGCGLIVAEREGRNIRYELVSTEFAVALRSIAELTLAITCDDR